MKSFISKKKDKAQDIIKISKNEIVIPNVNMAELDKNFAMAEMNNSLLKKSKNIQQTNIFDSPEEPRTQSIVFTDDDIEIDIEIDMADNTHLGLELEAGTGESQRSCSGATESRYPESTTNVCSLAINISSSGTTESRNPEGTRKEVMLENVKNKIKNLMKSSKAIENPIATDLKVMNFMNRDQGGPLKISDGNKSQSLGTNSVAGESQRSFSESLREVSAPVKNRLSKITLGDITREKLGFSEIKEPAKQINKIKKEFDIKNVVSKLETIGISEHKSYNYNTLIKNESIICNSYNSICNLDSFESLNTGEGRLNSLSCWWCRHTIPENLLSIGCPIKYHKSIGTNGSGSSREYFDTEGFFCSFNCVVAYNNDVSQTNIRYRETGGLIYLLYKKVFGQYPYQMNIKPALSWKVLKSYGGEMTIQEYRNTFQKVENVSENVIKNKSLLLSSSTVFIEEKSNIKLSQSEF